MADIQLINQLLAILDDKEIKQIRIFAGPPWVQQYQNVPKLGLKELYTICHKLASKMFFRVEYQPEEKVVLVHISPTDSFSLP